MSQNFDIASDLWFKIFFVTVEQLNDARLCAIHLVQPRLKNINLLYTTNNKKISVGTHAVNFFLRPGLAHMVYMHVLPIHSAPKKQIKSCCDRYMQKKIC